MGEIQHLTNIALLWRNISVLCPTIDVTARDEPVQASLHRNSGS